MRRFLRDNSLTLAFAGFFLATLVGQTVAGYHVYNDQQLAHGSETISYARYLVSSHFGEAMLENWQSEYLQFGLFMLATIWLVQRGSNESKEIADIGLESDEQQQVGRFARRNSPKWARAGGWRTKIYSNSLLLVMFALFIGSWLGQSVTAWTEFNSEQRDHDEPTVSWVAYLREADFWEKTLQNWQSEFLAVASIVVFTVYLRQRGSHDSKPVGSPHSETAASG